MDHNFLYMYKQLMGKSSRDIPQVKRMASVPEFVAGLMDDGHVVILDALLDAIQKENREVPSIKPLHLPPARETYKMAQEHFSKLQDDLRERLDDFCQNWKSRFSHMTLLSYLKSNSWIIEEEGRFRLAGRGTRQESRNLFQQSSLQDMVAEGARIVALFEGMLLRHQEDLAQKWHQEAVKENSSRLLPLLEAALRSREMDLFKNIRMKLPEIFVNLFVRKVSRWEGRFYSSEEELFKNIVWPWYNRVRHDNGFEGFTLYFVNFMWEITRVICSMYISKWRLFLRGLENREGKARAVSLNT